MRTLGFAVKYIISTIQLGHFKVFYFIIWTPVSYCWYFYEDMLKM